MKRIFLLFILVAIYSTVVRAADFCVVNPSSNNCTNYELPGVDQRVVTACGMMDYMPCCTVHSICQQAPYSSESYCTPFTIYKELCLDMNMGCNDYYSMCANGTKVHECGTPVLPLPSTTQAINLIKSICTEMPMAGCSKCDMSSATLNCDLLTVYSGLCYSMPQMSQCTTWASYCDLVPDWPLCSPTAPTNGTSPVLPPQMLMFFHIGIVDYVLLEQWVPRTAGQYAGTVLAVILMTIIQECIKFVRFYLETKWNLDDERNHEYQSANGSNSKVLQAKFKPGRDFVRALLHSLEVGWGLIVMLIAMTYNLGLFLAIMVGAFIGSLLFGRFVPYDPKKSDCCH